MADEMRKALIDTIIGADISLVGTDGKSYAEVYADALLEAGWKKIPVEVGDTVYIPVRKLKAVVKKRVSRIVIDGGSNVIVETVTMGKETYRSVLGEDAFLTEDEATRILTLGFNGDGKHDGKVIHCPDCDTPLLIKFGRASCFRCKWSASDADLDEIMTEDSDE